MELKLQLPLPLRTVYIQLRNPVEAMKVAHILLQLIHLAEAVDIPG